MISKTRPAFWRAYASLPELVKEQARASYARFLANPFHPSLHFKKLAGSENIWSVRISERYRAVGSRSGDLIEWFWVGSHNDFDKLF